MSHISYLNMTFTLYFIPWVMEWFYSLIRCPLNRTFSSYMHINQLCSCLFVFLFKTSKPKISFKRVQARSHSLPYSKQHIPLDLDFKFSDIVSTLGGKNLKRECLIDPSILEELMIFYFREVGTWEIELETWRWRGKWRKLKHDEKQRKKHHIRRWILKLPHANSAYYTSHLIMF